MTPSEYAAHLSTFDKSPATLWYYGLGLAGEAGESADKIKKLYRDRGYNEGPVLDFDRLQIALELGDTLWYLTRIAQKLGWTLDDIMDLNIEKLQSRAERRVLHGEGDNR